MTRSPSSSACTITAALKGDWCGTYGMIPGPGHSAKDRSVKVTDGTGGEVIVHSFAGDDWREVKRWLGERGLLPDRKQLAPVHRRSSNERTPTDNEGFAREIWRESTKAAGTLVERYLSCRGIIGEIPAAIRFHRNLKHRPTGLYFPALVAGLQNREGRFAAVQRTFLLPDGRDKAGVSSPRMSLGPCQGAAIRLAEPHGPLWICEGVEDALSVMRMTGRAAWALPGAEFFASIELPDDISTVVLAPDNDPAGVQTFDKAAARLKAKGRTVMVARPKSAKDWNDALMEYEERAAIVEHNGESTREQAERFAEIEVFG